MYEFTVPMGLMDFVPVALFGITAVLLQRDLYNKMPKYAFACFAAMFMPVNSIGFLLAGLGIILMFPIRKRMLAVAPPVFSGTFVFISMMVLGLGAICTCLSILAVKMKRKGTVVLFILTFICYIGMGYLGSRDSTSQLD